MTPVWFVGLAITSYLTTITVRSVARYIGVLDEPNQERWHTIATPNIGGISFYVGILVWQNCHPTDLSSQQFLCITVLFITGLIDDLRRLQPIHKSILIVVAILIDLHPWQDAVPLSSIILKGGFLFFFCNSFNIYDNMDGVASTNALLAALFYSIAFQSPFAIVLCAVLVGFLPFNLPKASIFMGDCGSLILGYSIASIMIEAIEESRALTSQVIVLSPLLIIIFDSICVTLTRVARKQHISQGGKDHCAHRIARSLRSEKKAFMVLVIAQAYMVGGGFLLITYFQENSLLQFTFYIPIITMFVQIYKTTTAT